MNRARKAAALLLSAVLAAGAAGCASPGRGAGSGAGGADGSGQKLTVFAAASLKEPFTALARKFEVGHPGSSVALSFAGSADLATQLSQGAAADVFASADPANMAKVSDAGLVNGAPQDFASNVLAIAVPPANPARIGSFEDLTKAGTRVVVCAPQVPCGAAAKSVQEKTGVTLQPVSEESSVTDVLGKVSSGEADAGLVYVTDVRSAGTKVKGIPFPEAAAVVNRYPIAALRTGRDKDLAAAFVSLVTGSEGRQVLADAGFGRP
ncbi:molybdate ABC transporter substrate-binding protein [Arthrobacter sp. B3I4]|uniref:molybdate ABC transporter substrate-binding protein n=1 Tax=Arthrobacter sp. B3I4 TaxID=3042267 RepID=UPI002780C062|nr:molybdate ABC transporter substrate-binding protein [Arthrobacter sp. B3I4]MDQ0755004.1 molybdate transport system substrate-binding protein [Arthrobacter sp. B3I4]